MPPTRTRAHVRPPVVIDVQDPRLWPDQMTECPPKRVVLFDPWSSAVQPRGQDETTPAGRPV